ncbi:MAG TPA: homocysteine S-methyltransferase [Nakamurella sp.]
MDPQDATDGALGLARAIATGPVVLDGGLATLLEAHGHDLSSALWSARLLVENPGAITAAHREYFRAGAQVAITASYQASLPGFAAIGLGRVAAEQALRRSVDLARTAAAGDAAAAGPRWVATSVGPYGAALADGSEYRGDYGLTVRQLREWHRPRLEILADAGGDVLAIETIPCQAEVEALLIELQALNAPAWLSLTCRNGRTRAGERADDVFAMAADVDQVIAVGVNCVESAEAADLVAAASENSGKPAVVYPNSGEDWDADARAWAGRPTFGPEHAAVWVACGARLVGGCCRVGPRAIRKLARSAPGWPVG